MVAGDIEPYGAGVSLAEEERKPLFVGDVLDLGDDDASSFLVQCLVGPLGVDLGEFASNTIVLAYPQGLHHSHLRL